MCFKHFDYKNRNLEKVKDHYNFTGIQRCSIQHLQSIYKLLNVLEAALEKGELAYIERKGSLRYNSLVSLLGEAT